MIQYCHINRDTHATSTTHAQVILLIYLLYTAMQVSHTYHCNDTILSHNSHNIVTYIHTILCYAYIYYIIIVVHVSTIIAYIIWIYCNHQAQAVAYWHMLYWYIYIIVLYTTTCSIKCHTCYISFYMAQNGAFWTCLHGHKTNYARMPCTGL